MSVVPFVSMTVPRPRSMVQAIMSRPRQPTGYTPEQLDAAVALAAATARRDASVARDARWREAIRATSIFINLGDNNV